MRPAVIHNGRDELRVESRPHELYGAFLYALTDAEQIAPVEMVTFTGADCSTDSVPPELGRASYLQGSRTWLGRS